MHGNWSSSSKSGGAAGLQPVFSYSDANLDVEIAQRDPEQHPEDIIARCRRERQARLLQRQTLQLSSSSSGGGGAVDAASISTSNSNGNSSSSKGAAARALASCKGLGADQAAAVPAMDDAAFRERMERHNRDLETYGLDGFEQGGDEEDDGDDGGVVLREKFTSRTLTARTHAQHQHQHPQRDEQEESAGLPAAQSVTVGAPEE